LCWVSKPGDVGVASCTVISSPPPPRTSARRSGSRGRCFLLAGLPRGVFFMTTRRATRVPRQRRDATDTWPPYDGCLVYLPWTSGPLHLDQWSTGRTVWISASRQRRTRVSLCCSSMSGDVGVASCTVIASPPPPRTSARRVGSRGRCFLLAGLTRGVFFMSTRRATRVPRQRRDATDTWLPYDGCLVYLPWAKVHST
jgi:hypothetical protein